MLHIFQERSTFRLLLIFLKFMTLWFFSSCQILPISEFFHSYRVFDSLVVLTYSDASNWKFKTWKFKTFPENVISHKLCPIRTNLIFLIKLFVIWSPTSRSWRTYILSITEFALEGLKAAKCSIPNIFISFPVLQGMKTIRSADVAVVKRRGGVK